jgi:hypothetical protein
MNTVLSDEQITKALEPIPEDVFRDWDSFSPYQIYREIAKSQDAHTRLELAKAVRKIEKPEHKGVSGMAMFVGYEKAILAVLKLMEGTK